MGDGSVPLAAAGVVILVVGVVLGAVSRLVLGRRSTMTFSGSVLAGIVGASLGGGVASLVTGGDGSPRLWPVLVVSILFTVAVLVVAERFVRRPPAHVADLIAAGESAHVEFKSTARFNLRSGQRDDRIEAVVAKTVAGLLNAEGGTLLVGVDDSGTVLGLADDLALMRSPDLDSFELWLHDYLTRVLGAPAVALVRVSFPAVAGTPICRVDVAASPRPVFVRAPKGEEVQFHVRLGNSTRQLSVAEAIEYAAQHFRRRVGGRRGPR